MNFREYLILENTTNQAQSFVKKSYGLNYDRELTIQDWLNSYNEIALWAIIDFCSIPVKIPNVSKKGNNNLDLVFIIAYLVFVEEKILYHLINLDNYLRFELNKDLNKYSWNDLLTILKNSHRSINTIDQKYLDEYTGVVDEWEIDNMVGFILKNNNYLNLLPYGNPASMSIKKFEADSNTRTNMYHLSEYFYDYLVEWLPKRVLANKWIKNFPSNIKDGFRKDNNLINEFIDILTGFNSLKGIQKEEIWNTYFIKHQGDRGIIRRFKSAKDFLNDLKNRINQIRAGKSETYKKIEKLGKQVDVVYDKDNILIMRINTYKASNLLGCDTSWCISSSLHYWDSYNNEDRLTQQYFIFNFNLDDDDIKSRIGVTVDQNGHATAAHFKNDNSVGNIWAVLLSFGIENPRELLKPISEEIIKKRNDIKKQEEKIKIVFSEALSYLKKNGKITGTTHHKNIDKALELEYFYDVNFSDIKSIGGLLLVLKKEDVFTELVKSDKLLFNHKHFKYLIKKENYDLIRNLFSDLDNRLHRDNTIDKVFNIIINIKDDEIYNEFYKLYEKVYYEYTLGEELKKINHSIPGSFDELLFYRNKDRIKDLLKKIPKMDLNEYNSDIGTLVGDQTVLATFVEIIKKEKETNLLENEEFIKWLLELGTVTYNVEDHIFIYENYKKLYDEHFDKMSDKISDSGRILKRTFEQFIENHSKIFTSKEIEYFINKGLDITDLGKYTIVNIVDNYKEDQIKFLLGNGMDLNKLTLSSYDRSFDGKHIILNIVDVFEENLDYLKNVLGTLNFVGEDSEGKIKIYNTFYNLIKYIVKIYLGTGNVKEILGSINYDPIFNISKEIKLIRTSMEFFKNPNTTDRQAEELIELNGFNNIVTVDEEILSLIQSNYPELLDKAEEEIDLEIKDFDSLSTFLKTGNVEIIRKIITPEIIDEYREDLIEDHYLIGIYIKDYEILKILKDNGYHFSQENLNEILKYGLDPKKEDLDYKKVELLMSDGLSFNPSDGYDRYDRNNTYLDSLLNVGHLSLIEKIMKGNKDNKLQDWGGVYEFQGRYGWDKDIVLKHIFDKFLSSKLEILRYFVEDIQYLKKLNLTENKKKWNINLSDIGKYYNMKYTPVIDTEKMNYVYKIYENRSQYPNLEFNLKLENWGKLVRKDINLIKHLVEVLGMDPTRAFHVISTSDYGRDVSTPRSVYQYLYDKGADIEFIYDEEKRSKRISQLSREFMKEKIQKIRSKNESIMSYKQFKDWLI